MMIRRSLDEDVEASPWTRLRGFLSDKEYSEEKEAGRRSGTLSGTIRTMRDSGLFAGSPKRRRHWKGKWKEKRTRKRRRRRMMVREDHAPTRNERGERLSEKIETTGWRK